jgi:hypothetical protein
MAKAYASTIIDAPVEVVWDIVRDFNAAPNWLPPVKDSEIEGGLAPDCVGCVRSLHLQDGGHMRERLLSLDDSRYSFSYNFEKTPFPVTNYVASFELIPVTNGDKSFAQWGATFDEKPEDAGKFEKIISNAVFGDGLKSLAARAAGKSSPAGAVRWQGLRPAKVFCSSVINGRLDAVWARVRDFAGMDQWHPDLTNMHMLDGARPDKVSGVRDFRLGDGQLLERLTYLSDTDHTFRYLIEKSPMPWLNYHAGPRFYPITSSNKTFAVWTADWVASPNDDANLIGAIHQNVFQKAFDTLNERFFKG